MPKLIWIENYFFERRIVNVNVKTFKNINVYRI